MSSPASLGFFEIELNRLVAKFAKEFTAVTDPGNSEARLRQDCLDPFTSALGSAASTDRKIRTSCRWDQGGVLPAIRLHGGGGAGAGRDHLYKFMRHWLSGRLLRERPALYRRLPRSFTLGRPMPERRSAAQEIGARPVSTMRAAVRSNLCLSSASYLRSCPHSFL